MQFQTPSLEQGPVWTPETEPEPEPVSEGLLDAGLAVGEAGGAFPVSGEEVEPGSEPVPGPAASGVAEAASVEGEAAVLVVSVVRVVGSTDGIWGAPGVTKTPPGLDDCKHVLHDDDDVVLSSMGIIASDVKEVGETDSDWLVWLPGAGADVVVAGPGGAAVDESLGAAAPPPAAGVGDGAGDEGAPPPLLEPEPPVSGAAAAAPAHEPTGGDVLSDCIRTSGPGSGNSRSEPASVLQPFPILARKIDGRLEKEV
jgi:hypothetical protein